MFESSLIQAKSKRWRVLPLSLALHLAAAGAVVSAAYWQVDEVEEPSLNSVFFVGLLPPAPPVETTRTATPTAAPPPRGDRMAPPQQTVQPTDVTDGPPAPTNETDTGPQFVDLGGPVSQKPGVPWGDPESHGPLTGTDPKGGDGTVQADLPLRVFGAVKRPEIIPSTRVEPRYTESARKVRLAGTVILEAVIDERGNVTDLEVLKGLPLGLDDAAVQAVSQWKFRPATLEGRAVKVFYTLTIRFELQ